MCIYIHTYIYIITESRQGDVFLINFIYIYIYSESVRMFLFCCDKVVMYYFVGHFWHYWMA